MFTLKIIVNVSPYKKLEFENAVTELISKIKVGTNNLSNGIKKDLKDETIYYFEEIWKSKEKMEEHFQSEIFQTIIGAMKVLGEIISAKIITSEKEEKINITNLNLIRRN